MEKKLDRREVMKAETRAMLVETARRVWAEPGTYDTVSLRDLAAAAGLSTGSVFTNWQGKADLWREAMGCEPPVDSPVVRAAVMAAGLNP